MSMQQKTIQALAITLFIGFLTWGIYTTLVYLGVPVHGTTLLNDVALAMVGESCEPSAFLCRGWHGLFPFLFRTVGRAEPLLWYLIGSISIYALFIGWQGLRTGQFRVSFAMKPWHILALFAGSVWLLFTVLSQDDINDVSIRRFVEPLPSVYTNIGPDSLLKLEENYQGLLERGCLTQLGTFQNGAKFFQLSNGCLQISFFTRVLTPLIFLLVLLFEILVLGRFILRRIGVKTERLLVESLLSMGLGVCGWILLLWIIAVAGIITSPVGWVLMIAMPLILNKHSLYWWRALRTTEWEIDEEWHGIAVLLAWLLISYAALNYLFVVRPFPIGWDDLGSYLNRPRLMVSYGHFVFSMAAFQWEYLTSLGFLLFGYNSAFGATTSMMINWLAGILAIATVYTFTNVFLGKGRGLLAALLYYTLPLVGHFSFADMKIDNAVFTMGSLAVFGLFLFLFPKSDDDERLLPSDSSWKPQWRLLIAATIFVGFAFAMKATAIMVIMMVGSVLLGALLHWSAFVGSMFFVAGVYAAKGNLSITKIASRITGEEAAYDQKMFLLALVIVGGICMAYACTQSKERIKTALMSVGIFIGVFLACIAPWIMHNNILMGNIIPRLELGAPNTLTPLMDISGDREPEEGKIIRSLPADLAVDVSHELCQPTGSKEELDRYWGFREGWRHYMTLPWRSVMNIDSAGYYVTTMPGLLLFPLLLLLPFFWMKRGTWLRWMFFGTLLLVIQWTFLANGIPWYGIGMFLGLVIGLEALVAKAPDKLNKTIVSILLALSLLIVFAMRFWQFEMQRNLLEYPLGKVTYEALRERTIPHYDDITNELLRRNTSFPDRPYLYRIGTFIPYFIPKNLEIIGAADHQLDLFNCLYQERDPQLTLTRLKALGFNSIIFDTNTATIEKDPNGTLHKKVASLVDFVNNPELGLQIVVNDPGAGVAYILIP